MNRVDQAKQQKEEGLIAKLAAKGIATDQVHILLRAFKVDKQLEVWAKNKTDDTYKKIISYEFCKLSGEAGPKRKQGDLQVPEGMYHIDRFNPKSKFFLSLGINYPNASDKILGDQKQPGGDIFIHGKCVTVGCIPITDPMIMELYILALKAKTNGQNKIQVQIFPTFMEGKWLEKVQIKYPKHFAFWEELRVFYEAFEQNHQEIDFSILDDGSYLIQ